MGTRRERVVLELEDDFTGKIARAAAAAELFQRSLGKTRNESDRTSASLSKADQDTQKFTGTLERSTRELDSYSGRLGIMASTIGALGPAAIPIGAVAIPAVTGLAQSLGLVAAAGGTAILAFQGVGDALSKMNKAALSPTAANLAAAQTAMEDLSPAAQDLVLKLQSMRGELARLKEAAGSGILPGASAAIDELQSRLPIVETILHRISEAAGQALREGAASLASPKWDSFFHFIATQARPELTKLARLIGDVAHALAEMWVAFGPLNRSFTSWLLSSARAFDKWATGLSATQGFHDFIAYLHDNGPKVAAAVGAIANALVQVVRAAAPIGGPVLDAITGVANAIAAIANSDLGTPIFGAVAAFAALNLAMKVFGINAVASTSGFVKGQLQAVSAIRSTTASMINLNAVNAKNVLTTASLVTGNAKVASSLKKLAGGAAVFGTLALVSSGAAQKVGLTNTAMLGLAGTMLGPWGAAAGAGIGLTMDLAKSTNGLADAIHRANSEASNPGSLPQLLKARSDLVTQFASLTNDNSGWFGLLGKSRRMWGYLTGDVGDTQKAIQGLDGRIAASRGENARYQRALGLTDRGFQLATSSAQGFEDQLASLNGLLSKRAALRDYQQALDTLTAGIKQNGRSLDINTAKGRANQANLDALVSTALKVAENMKGSNRTHFLEQARQDILDMGSKLDGGKAQADKLTQALKDLDNQKATPTIGVNTLEAFQQLNIFEQKLAGLTGKRRTVYINAVQNSIFNPTAGTYGNGLGVVAPTPGPSSSPVTHGVRPGAKAAGGPVSGPGTSTSDSIPTWLSDGEFVMRAAAVDKYGVDFMHQINAMRLADGGYATRDVQQQQAARSPMSNLTIGVGDLRVTGTLNTPWGPAHVEGIARAAARDEVNDSAALDRDHARMFRGGVRG